MSLQPVIVPHNQFGFDPNHDFTRFTRDAMTAINRANRIFKFNFARCKFSGYTNDRQRSLQVSLAQAGEVFLAIDIECGIGGQLTVELEDRDAFADPFQQMADCWLEINNFPKGHPCAIEVSIEGEMLDVRIIPA